ncbi:MAG: flagellar biosynthetic protein FliQ [Henriciella sp.]|jgi:flagellar biosynthetic protein FliQ|mmetsp:Transcript_14077/g.20596  ORF Transcript_14077/g.20596 Transcript_14077/m.20596 type:complete len:89 (+) Transcript_14077:1083-1349(+)
MMGEAEIFEALRASLWAAVLMGAPILLVTLVLGFVIGLFQALTSIQEMTLTFIPKIIAVVVIFFLTLGYMTRVCLDLFNNTVIPMVLG